jgi:microcystin degradation protein MlrC
MPTGMQAFRETMLYYGDGSVHGWAPAVEPLRVWRRLAAELGWQITESVSAFAEPAGVTGRAAFEHLRDRIIEDLCAAKDVDIVLLSLHGAMVAADYPDAEGELLERVRKAAGPDVTIGVEFDLHCQLTELKIESADIVVTYKEYPHIDIIDRAEEVFVLARRIAEGSIVPARRDPSLQYRRLYPDDLAGHAPHRREDARSGAATGCSVGIVVACLSAR